MRRTILKFSFHTAASIGLMIFALPVLAQPKDTPQVLVLNSYGENTVPYSRVRDVFREEMQGMLDVPIAFRQFDLGFRDENQPELGDGYS